MVVIILHRNDEQARIVLTLSEKETNPNADYAFQFTHRTTYEEVEFVLPRSNDESGDTSRYNQFTINVPWYFEQSTAGMWTYSVTDTIDQTELETGIMQLIDEVVTNPAYETDNTAIVYNGYPPLDAQ